MARGFKIAHIQSDGTTVDQRISNVITQGAVGGIPAWVTGTGVRTVKVQFRDDAGTLHANGFIISQKGSTSFLVGNAVGAVEGTVSNVTVCTLSTGADATNGTPGATASTMTIYGNTTAEVPFYASRITNKYVWDQDNNKMQYRWAATQVATSTYANIVVH